MIPSLKLIWIILLRKAVKKYRGRLSSSHVNHMIKELSSYSELTFLSELEHEKIVKYYGYFIEDEHVHTVSEFCEVNLFLILKKFLIYNFEYC